jgi:hypothetical protein
MELQLFCTTDGGGTVACREEGHDGRKNAQCKHNSSFFFEGTCRSTALSFKKEEAETKSEEAETKSYIRDIT